MDFTFLGLKLADIGLIIAAIGVVAVLVYESWRGRSGRKPRDSHSDNGE